MAQTLEIYGVVNIRADRPGNRAKTPVQGVFGMDLMSNMLSTLRLNASIFLHSTFCNEWVIDIGEINIATFHLVSHGDCWLHLPYKKPLSLH